LQRTLCVPALSLGVPERCTFSLIRMSGNQLHARHRDFEYGCLVAQQLVNGVGVMLLVRFANAPSSDFQVVAFFGAALGTQPVRRYVLPLGPWRNAVFWVPFGFVIDVRTQGTGEFLHI